MTKRQGYQQHIHVFRGVAIMGIVMAHTIPSFDWSQSPLTGRFVDALVNESSIFFFFIAGYLFQHLSARFVFRHYLRQKLMTVILPYLILSVPALIIFTQFTQRTGMWPWFYQLPVSEQVGLFLLTGKHLAPLWFVPTISLFYLLAPLLLWIDRRMPRLYWLIVPLFLLSTYLGRDGHYGPIDKAIYLLPAYLMGMAFSHYKDRSMALVQRWWLVLLACVVIFCVGLVQQWPTPPYYQMPMKMAACLLLVYLLYRQHHHVGHHLDFVAEVSFGIFFIHAYFISAIKVATVYLLEGSLYRGVDGEVIHGSVPILLVYTGVVLLLSVTFIWVGKKVFGKHSRKIIGA
ncbi:acyltransferase [Rhodoferax sp. 4810]|nr:acyltransferase [Rhodoferax jenense]